MANEQNLRVPTSEEAREIGRKGGIASGIARKERATMKKTLEMMLDQTHKNGKTFKENATLGLIVGAIKGNAQNYRTIVEMLGELQTTNNEPNQLKIEIIDNEKNIKGE